MIKVKNLYAKINGQIILKDISFSVSKGETICIIGPSGSGKSTILRCINNLQSYNRGSIIFNDEKIVAKNANIIRRKIGMVFQNFNLFPHMNILENLIYAPMKILGMSYADAISSAKEKLKMVDLSEKIYERPSNLSGGQKQRVAIARCLMMNPDVILFDEPTSALDPEVIREVVQVIISLKEQGVTMLVVTHHINFAKRIADRIFFIDHGILLENSTSSDFFQKPKSHRARLFLENLAICDF
jgi:ABC-type polar amino acid transport system ATPase subunit